MNQVILLANPEPCYCSPRMKARSVDRLGRNGNDMAIDVTDFSAVQLRAIVAGITGGDIGQDIACYLPSKESFRDDDCVLRRISDRIQSQRYPNHLRLSIHRLSGFSRQEITFIPAKISINITPPTPVSGVVLAGLSPNNPEEIGSLKSDAESGGSCPSSNH